MTEADLARAVREMCAWLRLYAYHTHDSRGSQRGFPDWVIIGPRGLLWRELKSAQGRLTPEQRAVGYALQDIGQDWAVWRPADLASGRIERDLRAITARGAA